MKWYKGRIIESFIYFGYFYLIIGMASPNVIAAISVVLAIFNILRNPKDVLSNYILLFIPSIFYNSLDGQILWREFSRSDSSVDFAASANWLGAFYVAQLLLFGQLNFSRYRWLRIDSLLLVLLVVFTLTSLLGTDTATSLEELKRYPSFIAFYIITRITINSKQRILEMLSVFYATIILVFLLAFQNLMNGTLYNALVDFVFLLAPVVHLSLDHKNLFKAGRLAQLFLLALGSLSLLISDSRRVLISIVIIWFSAFNLKRSFSMALLFLLPAIFLFQLVDFGAEFRYEKSISQLGEIVSDEGGNTDDGLRSLTTGRSVLWAAGVNLILSNPVLGVGLDNHIALLPQYGAYKEIRIHNIFLDFAAQTGLIGLMVFVSILIHLIRELRRLRKALLRNGLKRESTIVFSLFISFLAVIIFSFFGGSMLLGKWGWFQVGFIAAVLVVLKGNLRDYLNRQMNRHVEVEEIKGTK